MGNLNLLDVRGVSHRFSSGVLALKEVSFSLGGGEFVVLAGRNGSGKTVLMKHINGLLRPTEGEIVFDGRSVLRSKGWIHREIGVVFQNPDSCILGESVIEDTEFGPRNLGLPAQEIHQRAEELLTMVGLWEKRNVPPRSLSEGEKKRLTLAGILVMRPRLIILDEPFVGLDLPGVRSILELITSIHNKGATVIVITHDVEKVLAHSTHLFLMDEGRLLYQGSPVEQLGNLDSLGIRLPPGRRVEEMTWL